MSHLRRRVHVHRATAAPAARNLEPHQFPHAGAWAAGTVYEEQNTVAYAGRLYVSKFFHTAVSGRPPNVDTINWRRLTAGFTLHGQEYTPYLPAPVRDLTTRVFSPTWPFVVHL